MIAVSPPILLPDRGDNRLSSSLVLEEVNSDLIPVIDSVKHVRSYFSAMLVDINSVLLSQSSDVCLLLKVAGKVDGRAAGWCKLLNRGLDNGLYCIKQAHMKRL